MKKIYHKTKQKEIHKKNLLLAGLFLFLAVIYRMTNMPSEKAIDLSISLDYAIPLIPWSVIIYHSWYPTLFIIMYFMKDDKIDSEYITALFVTKFLCILTFIFLPSVVNIRQNIVPNNIFEDLIMLTYKLDNPFNGFPSSHVACASIAYHYTNDKGVLGKFFQIQMVLIILSTMTTRQHIMADCIGGILLASFVLKFIIPHLRMYDRDLFDPVL